MADFDLATELAEQGKGIESTQLLQKIQAEAAEEGDLFSQMAAAGLFVENYLNLLPEPAPQTKEYQLLGESAKKAVSIYEAIGKDFPDIAEENETMKIIAGRYHIGSPLLDANDIGYKLARKYRKSWLIFGFSVLYGIILTALVASAQTGPSAFSFGGLCLFAIFQSYGMWAMIWGIPAVWRWSIRMMGNGGVVLFVFILFLAVGFAVYGGGIYQFFKARKFAKRGNHSVKLFLMNSQPS